MDGARGHDASFGTGLIFGEDGLVVADVLGDYEGGAEAGLGGFASGFAHGLEAVAIFEQGQCAFRHAVYIAYVIKKACDAVVN
jgi:hypothetical protein